jgi:ribosomal protein S18 acetylase RimI-like enzyme
MTQPRSTFALTGPHRHQSVIVNEILRALPDWFGIEEAIVNYVKEVDDLPVFLARHGDEIQGFISIRQHFDQAAEVHLIAVRPEHHRAGVGRALLEAAQQWLRARQVEFLQVKTLSPARECEHYARTRLFYESMGFRPLEEFKTLWGERNPCLMMVRRL